MQSIVVVGASLAGLRAVEELRHAGFDGDITLVGDEAHRPYDRPPLSKQVLSGEWDPDRTPLTVSHDRGIDGLDITWRLGSPATRLDPGAQQVTLAGGTAHHYDGLIVATGCRPVLPRGLNADRPGVHTLRTLDDCMSLKADLDATPRRVVVVGAGFIGAEVAATCRQRGLEVTLVEAMPVPLQRATGAPVGALLADIHRDHGVDVRLGAGVTGFDGGERVEQVHLADGTSLDADAVLIGVGVRPNTEWLDGSGIATGDGVICDADLRAAPGVVAAGDVARWPSARCGGPVRVEHWENAITSGEHAARSLLGAGTGAYDPVPWFWSDQYDRKLQLAGLVGDADEMLVVDGSLDERRFAAIYRKDQRIIGVVAMNRPRQMIIYRKLVDRGASWEEAVRQGQ